MNSREIFIYIIVHYSRAINYFGYIYYINKRRRPLPPLLLFNAYSFSPSSSFILFLFLVLFVVVNCSVTIVHSLYMFDMPQWTGRLALWYTIFTTEYIVFPILQFFFLSFVMKIVLFFFCIIFLLIMYVNTITDPKRFRTHSNSDCRRHRGHQSQSVNARENNINDYKCVKKCIPYIRSRRVNVVIICAVCNVYVCNILRVFACS